MPAPDHVVESEPAQQLYNHCVGERQHVLFNYRRGFHPIEPTNEKFARTTRERPNAWMRRSKVERDAFTVACTATN